jgi:hypothetical protein
MRFVSNSARQAALFALISTLWLGCGGVDFDSGEFKSCSEAGAVIGKCGNTDPTLQERQQSIAVRSNNAVDVLFVVDNSGSMSQEQAGIGNKINGFLNKIKDLDWQIALTTTDSRTSTPGPDSISREWGDGQFRPFDSDTGSQYILRKSQVTATDAQAMLANAINVGVGGSGDERGINATYRAVERSGASLAVILISDEDECSTGAAGCPAATARNSDPSIAVNFIRSQLGTSKVFSFSSIIQIPGDSSCTTGANVGNVYKSITQMTGGVLGSVCASDYTAALNVLGQRVVELVNSVALNCAPQDMNKDGKADVTVQLEGAGVMPSSDYTVSGNTLSFTQGLPEGNHRFYYFCKVN